MNETRNVGPAAVETIEVLNAISIVSARLARNLAVLAAQKRPKRGGKRRVADALYRGLHR